MSTGYRALCVTVLATFAAGPIALGAEEAGPATLGRVDVLLTTSPTLSTVARVWMINEAAAIWRRHGIAIDWLPPTAVRPVASYRLRVLIVEKQLTAVGIAEPVAVGELVRPAKGHPAALVSIDGARHLVASVRGRVEHEPLAMGERRLGTVLGRALAHEIGHYLLDTSRHAKQGLMRPNFNALEFTDLREGTFALDHDSAAWLRIRSGEKFAYAQR
jgi:hypothetical protein